MKKKDRQHPHGVYEDMAPISRTGAERALKSRNKSDVIRTLIRMALNDPDWRWVEAKCVPFLSHADPPIRGAASTALGHLARLHHHLNLKTVVPLLECLAKDPRMGDKARDALDDIRDYVLNT